MIKLKKEVNKTKLFKEIDEYANEIFKNSYESEYAKRNYVDGAKHLFKLLRLPIVIKRYCECGEEKKRYCGTWFCDKCQPNWG